MTYALWIIQGLLALLFLFGGVVKLTMPIDDLVAQTGGMPGPLIQFVSVAEILGALGLVLPGLLRTRTGLTPLAAFGLVIIMIGAVAVSVAIGMGLAALFPLIVGLLAAFVAYGRWRLAPLGGPSRRQQPEAVSVKG